MDVVSNFVRTGLPAESAIDELLAIGIVDSTNSSLLERFGFFYKQLLNVSRNWIYRGHKPCEIEQMQHQQE